MHLEKIQTRDQAVEFVRRIAERFFPAAEDSRWCVESKLLPKYLQRECCHAVKQVRRWQTKPTLKVELVVVGSMLELEEMAQKIEAPFNAMVAVAIATCATIFEDNWQYWVADASAAAMHYLAEMYGLHNSAGQENGYQVLELSQILNLPLHEIADEFDDIEDIHEHNDPDDL